MQKIYTWKIKGEEIQNDYNSYVRIVEVCVFPPDF